VPSLPGVFVSSRCQSLRWRIGAALLLCLKR
jgi:hypothetical protein